MKFKPFPVKLLKPIRVCIEEIELDDAHINYTHEFEKFEFGEHEMCEIKAGTILWAQTMPNGRVYLFQTQHSSMVVHTKPVEGVDYACVSCIPKPREPRF